MFKIVDVDKLKKIDAEEFNVRFSKKTIEAIELLLNFNNEPLIRVNNKLLEYQNTNYENYQWILKDFIDEVNISTNLIIDCAKEVFINAKDIIFDTPTILNHNLYYNEKTNTIESETIKEHYIDYLNYVNELGLIASRFLKLYNFELHNEFNKKMLFSPGHRCMIDKNNQLIKYKKEELFKSDYREKRASIIVNDGKKIFNLLNMHKKVIDKETAEALEYFSCSDGKKREWYINNPLYSNNLSDEKIIPKCSQVHFYNNGKIDFDILSLESIKVTKKGRSFSYSFACSFDISYYIKKYLIEVYTKKDMFSFMCLYKDFLSNYDYINFRDKKDFDQDHPMIKEANLISEVQDISIRFDKRLSSYLDILNDIEKLNRESLFITKSAREWTELLGFPETTKKYFYSKFQINKEPTLDEFKKVLLEYANSVKNIEINKILDTDLKKEIFSNIEKVRLFFNEVIDNILTKIYESESINEIPSNKDFSRFFNKRDIATFHTTLKESIVIDCRDKDNINIGDGTKKILGEDKIEKLITILTEHKYHDYIEIDKDVLGKESVLTLENIINLIEKINNFNLPVHSKTALKFRKLKQYKANGIYFSFSKQLGLDFRDGFGAYIHEIAHHIDLNTENYNRARMVNYLYGYFCNRVTIRVEYYLKSEELIARAAEISLILLLGRYEKFKEHYDNNEIDEQTLIKAVNETFLKTQYSKFMDNLCLYKSEEYFDYEYAILNRDFKSIDYLLVYFKSFWSGKSVNSKDELRLPSNSNISYDNEKKFAKKNELSYNYFHRKIFKDKIHFS